jgi:hypothetical protein
LSTSRDALSHQITLIGIFLVSTSRNQATSLLAHVSQPSQARLADRTVSRLRKLVASGIGGTVDS